MSSRRAHSSNQNGYKRVRSRSRSRERSKRARTERYDYDASRNERVRFDPRAETRRRSRSRSPDPFELRDDVHQTIQPKQSLPEAPKKTDAVSLEEKKRIESQLLSMEAAEKGDQREARRSRWQSIKTKHVVTSPTRNSAMSDAPSSQASPQSCSDTDASPVEQKESSSTQTENEANLEANNARKRDAPTPAGDIFDTSTDSEDDEVEENGTRQHSHVRRTVDSSDDHEGYYRPQLGEILHDRYRIVGYYGKGVFSNVLRAKCLTTNKDYAIKLLRNNDYMKRAGMSEVKILERLTNSDTTGKSNTIRLLDHFVAREHLCLVFEAMDMNLRSLLKKYGKGVGLGIPAVRVMAFKILKSLHHLKVNQVLHCDLKPDNMLVSQDRSEVKIADLGSACFSTEEIIPTPLLVSRYYRAPELILGLKYDHAIDMFAFGCCLYEFATGKFLLKSKDNNHHLRMILEMRGMFPKKFLAKGLYTKDHFDDSGRFMERVKDPVSGKDIARPCTFAAKPTRNITQELTESFSTCSPSDKELVPLLADLIDRCLVVVPEQRITPEEALQHAFFTKQMVVPNSTTTESTAPVSPVLST